MSYCSLRHPRVEVDGLAGDAVCDAVAERVGQRVGDGAAVDVDRVHVLGAVAGELDREHAGAAADVQAARAAAELVTEKVLPDEEAALRGDENPRLAHDLGQLQREQQALVLVDPRRWCEVLGQAAARAQDRVGEGRRGRGLAPARELAHARGRGFDVLGAHATAAADDVGALVAPAGGQLGVLVAADRAVEAPAVVGVVAEVGIDAERQVGEVAQPRQHARHVVGRQAVDHQRLDALLLEVAGRAAELVALGAAPVLAEDAAHAVAAAAEAHPDRDARGDQRLDHLVGQTFADQRHRLEQDEVGRILLEDAGQQRQRLLARLRVDVAVDREGERDLAGAAALLDRLAAELDAAARDVHPVDRERQPRRAVGSPSRP